MAPPEWFSLHYTDAEWTALPSAAHTALSVPINLVTKQMLLDVEKATTKNLSKLYTPKHSLMDGSRSLICNIYRAGPRFLRPVADHIFVSNDKLMAQPLQFDTVTRKCVWAGLSCSTTMLGLVGYLGKVDDADLTLSGNALRNKLDACQPRQRAIQISMLAQGSNVSADLIVDQDDLPNDHVFVAVSNPDGVIVEPVGSGSLNFKCATIDNLNWQLVELGRFKAAADWPEWAKHDDYEPVRCIVDNIILRTAECPDFLDWLGFIASLPKNLPAETDLLHFAQRTLFLFQCFQDSDSFCVHDDNTNFVKATTRVRELVHELEGLSPTAFSGVQAAMAVLTDSMGKPVVNPEALIPALNAALKRWSISAGAGSVVLLREEQQNSQFSETVQLFGEMYNVTATFQGIRDAIIEPTPAWSTAAEETTATTTAAAAAAACTTTSTPAAKTAEPISVHLQLHDGATVHAKFGSDALESVRWLPSAARVAKSRLCVALNGKGKPCGNRTLTGYLSADSPTSVFLCWHHKHQAFRLLEAGTK